MQWAMISRAYCFKGGEAPPAGKEGEGNGWGGQRSRDGEVAPAWCIGRPCEVKEACNICRMLNQALKESGILKKGRTKNEFNPANFSWAFLSL